MHIAAVGWIYVTLMMAITEETVIAGIMTFFLYGVLPTALILYIGGSGQRKRRREAARLAAMSLQQQSPVLASELATELTPVLAQASAPASAPAMPGQAGAPVSDPGASGGSGRPNPDQ